MATPKTISPAALKERLGQATVIDVREYPEWAEAHLPGARLIPLGELKKDPAQAGRGEVLLLCRSGRRAKDAAETLCACEGIEPVVIEGGIEAWKAAGYPVRQAKGPISLERQVRIAAGSLVLLGLLVPGLQFLPYVVGAGLIFAGVTNSCMMGLLLAKLPWNRPRALACEAR